jgi:hypothetical protein
MCNYLGIFDNIHNELDVNIPCLRLSDNGIPHYRHKEVGAAILSNNYTFRITVYHIDDFYACDILLKHTICNQYSQYHQIVSCLRIFPSLRKNE